ncbi:PspE Rhodanese-related sulfurtransferase [Rhabdaerophilaceae bacterium]
MRGLLALIFAAFAAVVSPALAEEAPLDIRGAKTVNADGVIEIVQKFPNLVILDNRNVADFEAGRIEGAVRLIDTDVTSESVLARHVGTKETPILVYCNGLRCGRAAKVAQLAVGWGYTNVHYYALGMEEWRKRGLPLIR